MPGPGMLGPLRKWTKVVLQDRVRVEVGGQAQPRPWDSPRHPEKV